MPISDSDFLERWNRNGEQLIRALIKKHEGESKEVAGHWVLSTEPVTSIPDSLFDPQFCLNNKDFEVAKWMDTIRKAMDSKYKDTYLWMAKGKGESKGQVREQARKGKSKQGKGKAAVGLSHEAVGSLEEAEEQGEGKQGKGMEKKGKVKVGGKGQYIGSEYDREEWISSVLHIDFKKGCWMYRVGSCLDLPTLFLKLGKDYTATQLYRYWNTLPSFATKKPHAWGSPWLQAAAIDRKQKTGYYGHRSL